MKTAQAAAPAPADTTMESALADASGHAVTDINLAAPACEDADEPSTNLDPGDTLTPRVTALPPPSIVILRPAMATLVLPSLFPSVPKPPPDA